MVVIRRLEEEDVDGLCDLWRAFAEMREGMTKSIILNEDAQDYFFGYATGLLHRDDILTLVAEDGEKLVGYLIAAKQRRPPIYHHTHVAYLSDAYVSDSHRGKGILKEFLAKLDAWCTNQGITAVDVQIFDENKAAQDVYRHLGFHDYRVLMRKEIEAAPLDDEV